MCLGGGNRQPAPQQPQIIYQGPSDEDRRRDQEAADARLAAYQTQVEQQQALFQAQLQEQIAAANAETERLTGLFEEEAAARAERQSAMPKLLLPSNQLPLQDKKQLLVLSLSSLLTQRRLNQWARQ